MKIIDQYIYAIGQKLPMKGREEIKKELKSLLLDDIEAKYGENPSEKDLDDAICAFGSPGKIAKKYSSEKLVIGSGYTDLYFMIIKIMALAMTITFTTIFIVTLFTENLTGTAVLKSIVENLQAIINTSISGIGTVTIIFFIITRFAKEGVVDLEDDWTTKKLENILIEKQVESKIESVISIIFSALFIIFINFFPQLMTLAESSFEKSGILLGNTVNLELFHIYAIIFTIIELSEIVYHFLLLKIAIKTRVLTIMYNTISILTIILLIIMVSDPRLFVQAIGNTTPALIGFKAVFLIILVVSSIEMIVTIGKFVRDLIIKRAN